MGKKIQNAFFKNMSKFCTDVINLVSAVKHKVCKIQLWCWKWTIKIILQRI